MTKALFLRRLFRNQRGAVAVWMALLIPLSLGVAGLVVDIGYAYICQRELQMSTDAAAMAAAAQLPTPSYAISAGTRFSASNGSLNGYPNLNTPLALTDVSTTVTPGCVSMAGLPQCAAGSVAANAVRVMQTTTVPTFFIKAMTIFGIKGAQSITLSAESTAVMRGAQRGPYNVALVLDTTASMQQSDGGSNCHGSKVQCAEQGAQILLAEFSPCLPGLSNCGTATNGNVNNAVDEVSLFTFPAQKAGTQVANDEACRSNTPNVIDYPDSTDYGTVAHSANPSMPSITTTDLNTLLSQYQVVPLSSNYRTSDTAYASGSYPLNPLTIAHSGVTASNPSIVNAVGGNSYFGGNGCTGMQAQGGVNTFFAGALFTAQEYLAASSRAQASNVIVLLSDGDANGGTMSSSSHKLNADGSYPSASYQCQQAIDVAAAVKAAGTQIYVVGYGVAGGGCSTDGSYDSHHRWQSSGLTACSTLRQIASDDSQFFVDTSSTRCSGAASVTMNGQTNTLSAIFKAIAGDLTHPHLVSNAIAFTASN